MFSQTVQSIRLLHLPVCLQKQNVAHEYDDENIISGHNLLFLSK